MTISVPWVRYRSAAYLRGRGLCFGAGWTPFPPKATNEGKYAISIDPFPHPSVDICETSPEMFKDEVFDWVWAGRRLESIENPTTTLRELWRKLRIGGHFVVHVPLEAPEPPARQLTAEELREALGRCGASVEKAEITRDGQYLLILKKVRGGRGIATARPRAARRACVCRFGALGDMIMATPLIKALHLDGFEVTVVTTPYAAPVLDHNPYVSNLIIQERDAIPNQELGAYWKEWSGDYDRYVNLSESIEGALLKLEGRAEFYTHKDWRHARCNRNYFDFTMQLGGFPGTTGTRGELFFSNAELRECQKFRDRYRDKFLVLWAMNGSSHHKMYAFMEPVLNDWLEAHRDAVVVTVGDELARLMEPEHPQIINKAGQWPIRIAMGMAKLADLVVGPESAIINAAGCFATPKIPLLSHSSHENLCKYFENDFCLEPSVEQAPCYPCHQLHYSLQSCVLSELYDAATGDHIVTAPACTMAISGERMIARLDEVYSRYLTAPSRLS
jgi:hypothetical protein